MTTTKMARGVMALLFLIGCGDAARTEEANGSTPTIQSHEQGAQEGSSASPSETAERDAARPDESVDTDAGSPDAAPATKPAPADCSKRTGGALVTFDKGGESWTIWSTNAKMNIELFTAAAKGTYVTVAFNDLVDGVDCDGQFSWHVDAENMSLEADYDPSCDALPSVVEANKTDWLKANRWCPSKVMVTAYQGQ